MNKPNLLDYENYRNYLRDWYAWMKETKPGFSYRAFSQWAGFASPNHIQLIIQSKRNITRETIGIIVKILRLSRRESRYFELLVNLNQSNSPETKANIIIEMSRLFKKYNRNLQSNQIDYLSKWYYPVLRELASTKHFKSDRHWIAKRIGHGVSPRQADEAMEKLLSLGLFVRNRDSDLKQTESLLTTGPETGETASYFYHDQMIRLALEALRSQKSNERNFSGITLACRQSDIPEIVQILNDCRHNIIALLENRKKCEDDEVYQLNLQLFRVTKKGGES